MGNKSKGAAPAATTAGFSLVELVVVVVIIGVLAAIAVPRMSKGSAGAGASTLELNLALVRDAIERYKVEHDGDRPAGLAATVIEQLTKVTDVDGNRNATKSRNQATGHVYGPYLRVLPPLPVGSKRGRATLKVVNDDDYAPQSADAEAWLYDAESGRFRANLSDSEKSDAGKSFNDY
jgi:prepilin-type N-terminal cleavage/methylation domain-containing protein